MKEADLYTHLGEPITARGYARDARAGAVVLLAGDEGLPPLYVDGLESWGAREGNVVSVSGTLNMRAVIPTATVDSEGSVSHGLDGDVFVIDNPTWQVEP